MTYCRWFLAWILLAASALASGERPNIIFILADDLGYGDLGCYGQEKIQTPHIDEMAAEGMRFTQHYAGSTVCAPSRCSLMTGLHTGHLFVRGNKPQKPEGQLPLPAGILTMAKLLKKAGYATGAAGKWGLGGPGSMGEPRQQGFDFFFGYLCQRVAHKYYPTHLWRNEERIDFNDQTVYSHDLVTEEALDFICRHKEEPFFLYVPYTIPHAELIVPSDSLEPYEGKFPEEPYKGGHYCAQEKPHATFAGMVSRMDRDVGRILDLLEELGLDENTLVIFTSDNGPHREGGADPSFFKSSGPLRGIKRDLYEGGIRVPLVCRWPAKIKGGTQSDHVSAFWDFLPTFSDLAGTEIPSGLDGLSMAPVLKGRPEEQEEHEFLYWEFHERGFDQAVRMGDWKALYSFKDDRLELYDLKNDPGETEDLAGTHPRIAAKMTAVMEASHQPSADFPVFVEEKIGSLEERGIEPVKQDWLVRPVTQKTRVYKHSDHEISLSNGLIRRTFRLVPDAATIAFDNLMTGASLLRGIKPEAVIELNGERYPVGGLTGQEEYGYLLDRWVDSFTRDEQAFRLVDFKVGKTRKRLPWKRKRYCADLPWPPPGASVTLVFRHDALKGIEVQVHYEMYDGIPLLSKWITVRNRTGRTVILDTFVSEILAAVEYESSVEGPDHWNYPNLHVETDYAFHGMTPQSANKAVHWVPDPQYLSQVNYRRQAPVMLECRPPVGPAQVLEPGDLFESFRTFELIHDSTERERKGLAVRRMFRTQAPWITENPILMHVRHADAESVKQAVDQCAEVGFEMIIMTFGSGFNAESADPDYIAKIKELADYAHSKGIELGGYSLLASRRISDEHDVIHPDTGKTGGAIFGNSPCLMSTWGDEYFRKVKHLFEEAGLDLLEHDGSYPGDLCAGTTHPGHRGLEDSQWNQWKRITGFYRWCRARGIYLNVPDWYFLSGSNKTGMGYRETNWSLPRERQIILGRQNIFDGTWQKTPSMGWMFVPLVQYHGGGAAATLEPLSEHLDAYGAHLMQNFGTGVQACYRGPRLYDTQTTKALVKAWVDFYKKHRAILDSDIIHLRRADGRDMDGMMHVNPSLREKGLAMFFNPLDKALRKTVTLNLYYTGLTEQAMIREKDGDPEPFTLDRAYNVEKELTIPPLSATWLVIE